MPADTEVTISFEKIKLIIWDLDDTFWKGTLSETAIEVPAQNVALIRRLVDHGIVNSISSKNDPETAEEALRQLGIGELFVFNQINWEEKGQQILEKLKWMGLREENTLFIDDNPRNLEEVRFFCPSIMTAGPEVIPALTQYYQSLEPSDEAHQRLQQYRILEEKAAARKTADSNEKFLYESQIRITINRNCLEQLDRISELVARTNQLNFTKNRDDAGILTRLISNDWNDCAVIGARDRFGDYGIIGFYCYNTREKKMEHFLFSCRVLGMGIEQYVYAKLGYPDFTIAPPVAAELKKGETAPWVEEAVDEEIVSDPVKRNRVRILLKGPCDMSAIYPYLAGANITTEFNFVNDAGFVTTGQNHSVHIKESAVLSAEAIEQIVSEVPFITQGDFETKLFTEKYHVICYSLQQDLSAGLYQNKTTGHYISFSGYRYDLTDPQNMERFVKKEIQGHDFSFSKEIIGRFAQDWQFVGSTPIEMLLENLRFMYEHVPGNPVMLLLLGSEIPYEGYDESTEGLCKIYQKVNPVIREFAKGFERMRVIDVSDFIHSQEDYRDSINHFSRQVYYEIAGKICDYINELV